MGDDFEPETVVRFEPETVVHIRDWTETVDTLNYMNVVVALNLNILLE